MNVAVTKKLNVSLQPNFSRPPIAYQPASKTLEIAKILKDLSVDSGSTERDERFSTADEVTKGLAYPGMLIDYNSMLKTLPSSVVNTKGAGIKVAVLDDGLDTDHPDFSGAYASVIDTTSGKPPAPGLNEHGTGVAGMLGARSSMATNGITGIAPACTLIPIRIANGRDATPAYVIKAINTAISMGAQIINISRMITPDAALDQLITDTVNQKQVIIIAAAGDGETLLNGPQLFPSTNKACISVGSGDTDYIIANQESMKNITVVAAQLQRWVGTTKEKNFYVQKGSSSFYCPMISGIVALLLASGVKQTRADVLDALSKYQTALTDPAFRSAQCFSYKVM